MKIYATVPMSNTKWGVSALPQEMMNHVQHAIDQCIDRHECSPMSLYANGIFAHILSGRQYLPPILFSAGVMGWEVWYEIPTVDPHKYRRFPLEPVVIAKNLPQVASKIDIPITNIIINPSYVKAVTEECQFSWFVPKNQVWVLS